jgi:hypothetical protein
MMTRWNKGRTSGNISIWAIEFDPADWPITVTRAGSPPKLAM